MKKQILVSFTMKLHSIEYTSITFKIRFIWSKFDSHGVWAVPLLGSFTFCDRIQKIISCVLFVPQ